MNSARAMQVMDGLLLGDGGLRREGNGARFAMGLAKQLVPRREQSELIKELSLGEHLKYEEWIRDNVFSALCIPVSEGYPKITTTSMKIMKEEFYKVAYLSTLQSPLLLELYNNWYTGGDWVYSGRSKYIRGATKALPRHLMQAKVMPSITLAHWFLGDGCSYWFSKSFYPEEWKTPQVYLAACNFSLDEVLQLTSMLNNMSINTLVPRAEKVKKGSGLSICLSSANNNIDHFMDIVEPHILEVSSSSVGPSYKNMIKRRSDVIETIS